MSRRQETYSAADKDPQTGKPLDVGIHDLEEPGAAKKQDGFFHKGILQAFESDHPSGTLAPEVKVVANGHCHRKCYTPVFRPCLSLDLCSHGKLPSR